MVSRISAEMVTEIVLELELEMASGMPLESKSIGHICFEDIHNVWLAPLLLCLLFLFEMDVIAIPEECWADWKYRYHYANDYDVTCLFSS